MSLSTVVTLKVSLVVTLKVRLSLSMHALSLGLSTDFSILLSNTTTLFTVGQVFKGGWLPPHLGNALYIHRSPYLSIWVPGKSQAGKV